MEHDNAFDFSGAGKLAFSVREVRLFTGLSISSIYRLISSNRLRSVKIEGRRFIMRCDLEALFAQGVSISRNECTGSVPRKTAPLEGRL